MLFALILCMNIIINMNQELLFVYYNFIRNCTKENSKKHIKYPWNAKRENIFLDIKFLMNSSNWLLFSSLRQLQFWIHLRISVRLQNNSCQNKLIVFMNVRKTLSYSKLLFPYVDVLIWKLCAALNSVCSY